MGVLDRNYQVGTPHTQDATGASVDKTSTVTATAAEITIDQSAVYTVTSDVDTHWEIAHPDAGAVTAATAASPTLKDGNYYFLKGSKISVIRDSSDGNIWLVPSIV